MILITGGVYQGKLSFAADVFHERKKMIDGFSPVIENGENLELDDMLNADIVFDFHLFIKKILKQDRDPYEAVNEIIKQKKDMIITVAELGCGVVPIEPFDRLYRETCGRICCLLASKSEEVYRVVCGVGMKISKA